MKFETSFDFLKALVENNGVLYNKKSTRFLLSNNLVLDMEELLKHEWFTTEPLKDKDPVEAWDNKQKCTRRIGFYDAKNNCLFGFEGDRKGAVYANYQKLDNVPEWMIEAKESLED